MLLLDVDLDVNARLNDLWTVQSRQLSVRKFLTWFLACRLSVFSNKSSRLSLSHFDPLSQVPIFIHFGVFITSRVKWLSPVTVATDGAGGGE